MSMSAAYLDYVLEQLGRVRPVTARRLFGGAGIYADGRIFALVDDDTLYFKVDDTNRPDFEAAGMRPFEPREGQVMSYWEVPGDVLEDVELLEEWMERALAVGRKRQGPGFRGGDEEVR